LGVIISGFSLLRGLSAGFAIQLREVSQSSCPQWAALLCGHKEREDTAGRASTAQAAQHAQQSAARTAQQGRASTASKTVHSTAQHEHCTAQHTHSTAQHSKSKAQHTQRAQHSSAGRHPAAMEKLQGGWLWVSNANDNQITKLNKLS